MVHLTTEQLAAMFSKGEISRGISSRDITKRKKDLGLSEGSFKGQVFTPSGSPREEFVKSKHTAKPTFTPKERQEISEALRNQFLPSRLEEIKSGERKGELVRKRRFGQVLNPNEAASEAQKEAVKRFKEEPPSTATNLSIFQLIQTGKLKNMTFIQLSDEQKKQFEVLRQIEPARHRKILAQLRANEVRKPVSELTKQQASDILRQREVQRKDQLIFGLQGQLPDDPSVQNEINQLTQGQRNAAVEELFSFASRKGKASPLELTPGQVRFILSQVKKQYTREGVRKIQ